MRFWVEPSPAGGFRVMTEGSSAPVSLHDTEEEAEARRLAYARGAAERVRLRDGALLLVRPLEREDAPLLAAGFERLGAESRYRRFMGFKKGLPPRELDLLTSVDHHEHEAITATDADTERGVGVAHMYRHPDRPEVAEVAVTVVDEWQGRGVGGVLLERLAARAREDGVRVFTASLMADNRAMLRLFERVGRVTVGRRAAGALELEVELSAESVEAF
jgi:GNAT superfamily N-acetyltransferase